MTPSPPTPIPKTARNFLVGLIILAILGFADALFLTVEHYRGAIIPCTITSGCQAVTTSKYATIGPIPIALLGALYYLAVVAAGALILSAGRTAWLRRLPWLTSMGFVFSLYLVGLQAFVIHAYCQYCLISAGISTLIFFTSLVGRKMNNGGNHVIINEKETPS